MKGLSALVGMFSALYAPREPEVEKHYFVYRFDDPSLRPLFVEVEVQEGDPDQEPVIVEAAGMHSVITTPLSRIAREAIAAVFGEERYSQHCIGQLNFRRYLQETGLDPSLWCAIRRGGRGEWMKLEVVLP